MIESAPPPKSAWRRRLESGLARPAAVAAILVVGLVAGSAGGFIVGYSNPRTLSGIGYLSFGSAGTILIDPSGRPSFPQDYGRVQLPHLTAEGLEALGEQVDREVSILSGRSEIPVLCETAIGQPGSSTYPAEVVYPATVYRVSDGLFKELIWPHPDSLAASRTLHTLVFQAQLCPNALNAQASVRTTGVLNGIGDEYVTFVREPTTSGPDAFFATVVLVRIGADLIEISFVSDRIDPPDAEARCLRLGEAAVERASGG